jgi:hypothetical protein
MSLLETVKTDTRKVHVSLNLRRLGVDSLNPVPLEIAVPSRGQWKDLYPPLIDEVERLYSSRIKGFMLVKATIMYIGEEVSRTSEAPLTPEMLSDGEPLFLIMVYSRLRPIPLEVVALPHRFITEVNIPRRGMWGHLPDILIPAALDALKGRGVTGVVDKVSLIYRGDVIVENAWDSRDSTYQLEDYFGYGDDDILSVVLEFQIRTVSYKFRFHDTMTLRTVRFNTEGRICDLYPAIAEDLLRFLRIPGVTCESFLRLVKPFTLIHRHEAYSQDDTRRLGEESGTEYILGGEEFDLVLPRQEIAFGSVTLLSADGERHDVQVLFNCTKFADLYKLVADQLKVPVAWLRITKPGAPAPEAADSKDILSLDLERVLETSPLTLAVEVPETGDRGGGGGVGVAGGGTGGVRGRSGRRLEHHFGGSGGAGGAGGGAGSTASPGKIRLPASGMFVFTHYNGHAGQTSSTVHFPLSKLGALEHAVPTRAAVAAGLVEVLAELGRDRTTPMVIKYGGEDLELAALPTTVGEVFLSGKLCVTLHTFQFDIKARVGDDFGTRFTFPGLIDTSKQASVEGVHNIVEQAFESAELRSLGRRGRHSTLAGKRKYYYEDLDLDTEDGAKRLSEFTLHVVFTSGNLVVVGMQ